MACQSLHRTDVRGAAHLIAAGDTAHGGVAVCPRASSAGDDPETERTPTRAVPIGREAVNTPFVGGEELEGGGAPRDSQPAFEASPTHAARAPRVVIDTHH